MPATSDSSPAYSRARPTYSAGAAVASSDSSSPRRARSGWSRGSRGVWAVAIGSAAQPLRHTGGRDLLLGAAVEVAELDDVAGELVLAERERVARAEPARPLHPLAGPAAIGQLHGDTLAPQGLGKRPGAPLGRLADRNDGDRALRLGCRRQQHGEALHAGS